MVSSNVNTCIYLATCTSLSKLCRVLLSLCYTEALDLQYSYGMNFVIRDVNCTSAEARLSDCVYSSSSHCDLRKWAGVRCRAFKYVNVTINGPQDTVHSVLITWEYHRHNNTARQLTNFKVECFSKQHNISYLSANNNTFRASIGGLIPFTSYNCCVSSIYSNYGYLGRSYTAERRCTSVAAMNSLTTVNAVTTAALPTEIIMPPQQSGDSNMKNNDMRVNIIGGALGFVIVILLLLLAICGGALIYLLRSKSVIPKRYIIICVNMHIFHDSYSLLILYICLCIFITHQDQHHHSLDQQKCLF